MRSARNSKTLRQRSHCTSRTTISSSATLLSALPLRWRQESSVISGPSATSWRQQCDPHSRVTGDNSTLARNGCHSRRECGRERNVSGQDGLGGHRGSVRPPRASESAKSLCVGTRYGQSQETPCDGAPYSSGSLTSISSASGNRSGVQRPWHSRSELGNRAGQNSREARQWGALCPYASQRMI